MIEVNLDYHDILDNISLMIWKLNVINGVTLTEYLNNTCKLYNDANHFFNKEIIHKDDLYEMMIQWKIAQHTGIFEVKRRLKINNVYRWVLTRGIRKGTSWYGSCIDINELMELRYDKINSEKIRKNLSQCAVLLDMDAKRFAKNAVIAETTRIQLAENAILAEIIRIDLEENAEILAENAIIAENKRLHLEKNAEILAENVIIAENKRLYLEKNAEILAENAIIAENKRLHLEKDVKRKRKENTFKKIISLLFKRK